MEEEILKALQTHGPLTSHQLCEILRRQWTDFSAVLLKMLRNDFNKDGPIVSIYCPKCGSVYHRPEQVGNHTHSSEPNL